MNRDRFEVQSIPDALRHPKKFRTPAGWYQPPSIPDKYKFVVRYGWTNADGTPASKIVGYYETEAEAEADIIRLMSKCGDHAEPERIL
jgi:hypothetical protein